MKNKTSIQSTVQLRLRYRMSLL